MENKDYRRLVQDPHYFHKGTPVARVTRVLASMIAEEYIAQWANSLGFKHKSYRKTLEEAAEKGTLTHQAIEEFFKTGKELEYNCIHPFFRDNVKNAFGSFMDWWNKITSSCEVQVIYSEHELVTEYYGGTMDLLVKIDGEYYIVDFKTSNNPSFKYFIQLASYTDAIEQLEPIKIRGVIVLQLSKTEILFHEYMADYQKPEDKLFMDGCLDLFYSILEGYYQRLNVENEYKEYMKRRRTEK